MSTYVCPKCREQLDWFSMICSNCSIKVIMKDVKTVNIKNELEKLEKKTTKITKGDFHD